MTNVCKILNTKALNNLSHGEAGRLILDEVLSLETLKHQLRFNVLRVLHYSVMADELNKDFEKVHYQTPS